MQAGGQGGWGNVYAWPVPYVIATREINSVATWKQVSIVAEEAGWLSPHIGVKGRVATAKGLKLGRT